MSEIKLEVVIERLKGLDALINEKFDQNQKQHQDIIKRQDRANHRTTKLEEWKAGHTKEIETEIAGVLLKADGKYAAKIVEKHFYKLILAVVIAVLMAGMGLLFK